MFKSDVIAAGYRPVILQFAFFFLQFCDDYMYVLASLFCSRKYYVVHVILNP